MSNETSDRQGNGGQRRRSRGGRNRNRNRSRNPEGSGGGRRGDGGGERRDGRKRSGGNRNGGQGRKRERRAPKPVPLTWWQKLLKAIGLYKEPTRPSRGTEPKSNTRVAKTAEGESGEPKERKPKRQGRDNDEHRERRVPENVVVESNRLYLGNLSYETTESDLEELFKGVGTVRGVEIVYNRQTHRSKGYGFINMINEDEAKRSIEILHDQFFMGRRLVVSGAKSQGAEDDSDDSDAVPAGEDRGESV